MRGQTPGRGRCDSVRGGKRPNGLVGENLELREGQDSAGPEFGTRFAGHSGPNPWKPGSPRRGRAGGAVNLIVSETGVCPEGLLAAQAGLESTDPHASAPPSAGMKGPRHRALLFLGEYEAAS